MNAARLFQAACVSAMLAASASLGAQQPIGVVTSWSPFLGCWSTSSAGAVGPMVCVVPTSVIERVEFMTVDGDSIVARTIVDASGARMKLRSGACDGWERARWSEDGRRLLMHAEYACPGRGTRRSDAIMSMTLSDAFTRVERVTNPGASPARVVNFIVQLDTTVFPVEVRGRLPYLRPLAMDPTDLEALETVSRAAVIEAATELDAQVVNAWLADRGQELDMSPLLRVLQLSQNGERLNKVWSPRARDVLNRGMSVRAFGFTTPLTADYGIFAELPFGVPFAGYAGGFPWRGWP